MKAYPTRVKRRKVAKLSFDVADNSGKATVTAALFRSGRIVKSFGAEEVTNGGYYVNWRALGPRQTLSFCVLAQDAAGNKSKQSCAAVRVT